MEDFLRIVQLMTTIGEKLFGSNNAGLLIYSDGSGKVHDTESDAYEIEFNNLKEFLEEIENALSMDPKKDSIFGVFKVGFNVSKTTYSLYRNGSRILSDITKQQAEDSMDGMVFLLREETRPLYEELAKLLLKDEY